MHTSTKYIAGLVFANRSKKICIYNLYSQLKVNLKLLWCQHHYKGVLSTAYPIYLELRVFLRETFIIALFSMFIISKLYLSAGGTIFIISKLCLIFFLFNRSSYQGSKARKSRLWRLNFFETACQVENGIRAKLIWSKKEKRINLKSALRRKVDLKMDAWHWCKPNHLLLTKDFYPEKKFKPISVKHLKSLESKKLR